MDLREKPEFSRTSLEEVTSALGGKATPREIVLEQLCRLHWPAIYGLARCFGYAPEEAEDLTQAFFASFLEEKRYAQYDPSRGNLRSFLSASFRNFSIDHLRKIKTQKRGGQFVKVSIDSAGIAGFLQGGNINPHAIDQDWALAINRNARERLRLDYDRRDKAALYQTIEPFLLPGAGEGDYASTGKRLGLTESGTRNAVFRMRRLFRAMLQDELAEILTENEDSGDLYRFVIQVVGSRSI